MDDLLKSLTTEQLKQILVNSGYNCEEITDSRFVSKTIRNTYVYTIAAPDIEGFGAVYVKFENNVLEADF